MKAMRRTPTPVESLMRWLAAWLAVAVCAQALAVSSAGVRGLGHRHGALETESKPMLLWRHAANATASGDAHALAHVAGEAHEHALDDASVLGSDAHAAALSAFVTAPAPRPTGAMAGAGDGLRHVFAAAASWSPSARSVAPPRQPPRA